MTEPRSCIQLDVTDLDADPTGTGTYYDDAGDPLDLLIDDADLGGGDSSQDTIRAGAVRGTATRNGDDATSQPFELSFSGCSRPFRVCLL